MQSNAGSGRIFFLQALRGAAAVIVMVYHLALKFWTTHDALAVSFPWMAGELHDAAFWLEGIGAACARMNLDLGCFGVALFFLISGFVISLSLEKQNSVSFLVARVFRIYPLYLVGLALTMLSIFAFTQYLGLEYSYTIVDYLKQGSLLGDWFWLPSIDGIVWTLEVELKFYLLICVIHAMRRLNSARALLATAAGMCLFNILVSNRYGLLLQTSIIRYRIVYILAMSFVYLIYMFIGVCFYNFYKKYWDLKKTIVAVVSLYLLYIAALLNGVDTGINNIYLTSYTLALLLFAGCYAMQERIRYNRLFQFFGDISYPLYVVHGVNGYILMSVLDMVGVDPYVSVAVTMGLSILLAYVLHRLVELPSNIFGKKIAKKIGKIG